MSKPWPGTVTGLSRYVYGTTRLGDESIPFESRVAIAREAIASGLGLHTSHQYGNALAVLREALDADRSTTPTIIFKIGWSSVEEVRGQIDLQLEALALQVMPIGQLCPGGPLAEDLRTGGPAIRQLRGLLDEGLVGRFVLECWPWTSQVAFDAISHGHAEGLIEGPIFYLNPLQRFVSNELWDLLLQRQAPIVAMRTVSGGDVRELAKNPNAPDYLRRRAAQVLPIFEASGCKSWPEFALRFSLNLPGVVASVGATSRSTSLQAFVEAAADPKPLGDELVQQLLALHRIWSEDHDRHAEPWSM